MVRVRNQRTGTVRSISQGQMLKLRKAARLRIDERVFMKGMKGMKGRDMRKPTINMQEPVNESSQLRRIGHDAESNTAVIEFGKKDMLPAVYHFKNVSQGTAEEIRTAESAGSAFHRLIKTKPAEYPAHRVEGKECDCFEVRTCDICSRPLNQVNDPQSQDCGGTCIQCMADAGDPDCIASLAQRMARK